MSWQPPRCPSLPPQEEHMRVNSLPIPAMLLLGISCAGSNIPAPSAPSMPLATEVPPQSSNLTTCEWFLETQLLRARRVAGLADFIAWYQEHSPGGFDAITI